jgi:glycosyltransferase involved in cell wall biosynthesis
MKILQISFHTSPFGSVGKFDSGGLNIYVQQTSKLLSKNHEVTVVTGETAESFKENNLEFLSLNLFEKNLSVDDKEIHLQEFRKKLDEFIDLKSFDVIHAHYWLSGLIAKQVAEEFKIPLIYTSHSLGIFLEGYNKERVDCEKMVMTSSDFVTASSEFENVLISENYKIDKNKIKQITPGVDREVFLPNPSIKRENIFLSIGRIQPQKGQLEVLKFLNNFRKIESNFKCFFIGGPSGKSGDEYLEELKKSIEELDLISHVEFLDNLSQSKIKEFLNRSKLLLHTSKFETFGLVAIEANSMGVPVLTTNRGSLVEIIEDNINGFLSENLVESSVNTFVNDLLYDESYFQEIMNNCIETSLKYDWQNTANSIEKLYKVFA